MARMSPISILFILAIEVLTNKVNNKEVKGIIDHNEIKISLLADHICLILKDIKWVQITLDALNIFIKCAGLKINTEKTS